MKLTLKSWLCSLFVLVFTTGIGALLVLTQRESHELACKTIEVSIPGEMRFVNEEEVLGSLSSYGIIIGERLCDIDLARIENILNVKPSVKQSEAWVTQDGVLHIAVYQREPVLKIVDKKGRGYYADAEGIVFPLSTSFDAQVPQILCSTSKGMSIHWLTQAISLVNYISGSEKWNSRIISYSIAENNDFILHSDKEQIIFGDFKDRERKFSYLDKYFTKIQPREEGYKIVNLKYNGQIICRKKDM